MDGLSVLYRSTPEFQPLLYSRGNAVGWLSRSDKTAAAPYNLCGRLYLAKSGWLLLSVPNAFVRGVFDALTAPGAELPTTGLMNVPNVEGDVLNAHISVMTAAEVEQIGADKINERGHMFHYALGPVEEIPVHNVEGVSKVWAVQIKSPALAALRKSYGLSPYINNNHQFHITVAARRKNVLGNNEVSKFDAATGRGEWKAAETITPGNEPIDFDKWHGKAFKIVTTPPGMSVASNTDGTKIPDEPGRVSIVTPENGASWNWPAAPQATIDNFKNNWSSIQGGIAGYKRDQITRAMRTQQQPVNVQSNNQNTETITSTPTNTATTAETFNESAKIKSGAQKNLTNTTTYDCGCSGPCMCPDTCVCKQHGKCGHHKKAEDMPWRDRVEVYTRHPQSGKIYGGVWDTDKSFAVPGGGIDPGETPEQAALRELEEETGIKATNPVRLPIPPVENRWSDKHRAEKAKVGRGHFAGTRTHFVMVDFMNKLRNKQLDHWGATDRKFYSPAKALKLMVGKKFMAPDVAAGRMAALKHILERATQKTAADLLPGGAADNMPDKDFSAAELAKGKKHEHEHTNNDQVAAEIAKDHLQENPDYYKKRAEEEVTQENKEPKIILQLRAAKEHSDNKRYAHKNEILRKLMHRAPDEWFVDDPTKYHMGITHAPTKFRFHVDPRIIPVGVPVQKAASKNPYLGHLFDFREPLVVPANSSLWQKAVAHLERVVDKGNRTAQMQQNTHGLFAAMDPGYKHQMNMALARGEWPKPDIMTQLIQRHGSGVLSALK